MVRGAGLERFVESPKPGEPLYEPNDPAPERLGYTDYNLFYNPGAERRGNYGLAVAGKQERLDPGFALNDAPAGGSIDDQVDPRFAAGDKIPVAFPYADEDIIAGTTTVCQILRFYRSLFAPGPGSPLAGAGDPADGAGNNIGAVGNGGPEDRLGTLCPGDDVGAPALGPPAYVCPKLPPSRTAPLGGASSERTLVCVCEQASAPPAPGLAAAVALGAALLAARTRRRSSCARRRP
jgi:hypothetical protein